jgi:hypothetical protein
MIGSGSGAHRAGRSHSSGRVTSATRPCRSTGVVNAQIVDFHFHHWICGALADITRRLEVIAAVAATAEVALRGRRCRAALP